MSSIRKFGSGRISQNPITFTSQLSIVDIRSKSRPSASTTLMKTLCFKKPFIAPGVLDYCQRLLSQIERFTLPDDLLTKNLEALVVIVVQ